MNAETTKLQSVENDLKELMADVSRAMERAEKAIAAVNAKPGADTKDSGSAGRQNAAA